MNNNWLLWIAGFVGALLIVILLFWIIGFIPVIRKNNPQELQRWMSIPLVAISGFVLSITYFLLYLVFVICAVLTIIFGFAMNAVYLLGVSYNPMAKGRQLAHRAMAMRNIVIKKDIEDAVERETQKWSDLHARDKNTINQLTSARKHWEKEAKKIRQEYFAFNQKVQGAVANHETFKAMKNTLAGNTVRNIQGYAQDKDARDPRQQQQQRNNGHNNQGRR